MSDLISAISLLIGVATLFIGLVTWVITQLMEWQARKATHTADFLSQLSTNESLSESHFKIAQISDAAGRLDPSSIDEDTERHVTRLLNFYEYMSVFYYHGVLDHALVRELRGGPVRRTFRVCEELILEWRRRLAAPKLFEYLERLAKEVTPPK